LVASEFVLTGRLEFRDKSFGAKQPPLEVQRTCKGKTIGTPGHEYYAGFFKLRTMGVISSSPETP
jgi:hypothetical protein